jgi:hypothetical protein
VHAEQAEKNAATIAALVHLHNALSATSAASQVEMGMVVKELAEGTTSTNPPRPKKDAAVKKPKSAKALAAQAARTATAAALKESNRVIKMEGGAQMSRFSKLGDAQMVAGPSSMRSIPEQSQQYQHPYTHPYYQPPGSAPLPPPSSLPPQYQQHHPYANHFSHPPTPVTYFPNDQQSYGLLPAPRPNSPPSVSSYAQSNGSTYPSGPHSHQSQHSQSMSQSSHPTSPGSPPQRAPLRLLAPHPAGQDGQRYYGGGPGGPYGKGPSMGNPMLPEQQHVLHHQDQQYQQHQQQQHQRREQQHHLQQQQHQQHQQPPPQQQQQAQAGGAQTGSPTRPTLPSVNELLAPAYDRAPASYKEPTSSYKEPIYYGNPSLHPSAQGSSQQINTGASPIPTNGGNRTLPDMKPFALPQNGSSMGLHNEYQYGGYEGFRSGSAEISPSYVPPPSPYNLKLTTSPLRSLSNSTGYPPHPHQQHQQQQQQQQHQQSHHPHPTQHGPEDPHYPNYSLSVPPYARSQSFQLPTQTPTYSLPPLVPQRSTSAQSVPSGIQEWGTPRGWFKEGAEPSRERSEARIFLPFDSVDEEEGGGGGGGGGQQHGRSISHGGAVGGYGGEREGKKRSRTTEDGGEEGGWKRLGGDGTTV